MNPSTQGVPYEELVVVLGCLRHGSINQAAQALGVGQSTASRRLARLEARLGARLFDRTSSGLSPTKLALDLEPHARLVEASMTDIQRLAAGYEQAPAGRVRLTVVDGLATSWLIPKLSDFFDQYPNVEVDLIIVRAEADIAVRFVRPTNPDLIVQHLGTIPLAPYSLTGAVTQDDRWLMFDDPNEQFLETTWLKTHIQPTKSMRLTSWNALFAGVKQGLGPALVSPLVAEPAGLKRHGNYDILPQRELVVVLHRAMRQVPRVAAIHRWLTAAANDLITGSTPR